MFLKQDGVEGEINLFRFSTGGLVRGLGGWKDSRQLETHWKVKQKLGLIQASINMSLNSACT